MQFNKVVTVTGMKPSKGVMENGMAYDSTKVYVVTLLDASKDKGCGSATVEYNFGLSDEYSKFKHLFIDGRSIQADVDFEQVTNGKTSKTIINGMKPVSATTKA